MYTPDGTSSGTSAPAPGWWLALGAPRCRGASRRAELTIAAPRCSTTARAASTCDEALPCQQLPCRQQSAVCCRRDE